MTSFPRFACDCSHVIALAKLVSLLNVTERRDQFNLREKAINSVRNNSTSGNHDTGLSLKKRKKTTIIKM